MTGPGPGAIGGAPGRASRLLWGWDAQEFGTFMARTGQAGQWQVGGGGIPGWTRGYNGLWGQSPGQSRFEVGDVDDDGVPDERTSVLLEPVQTNLIENSSAELDTAGFVPVAAGEIVRETGKTLHAPGTALGVSGVGVGDGVSVFNRDGGRIQTTITDHAVVTLIEPAPSMVGRSVRLQLEWYSAANVLLATNTQDTQPLRAGWNRVTMFVPASAVPATTTQVNPRAVLASAGEGAFSIAGWTLVPGHAAAGSPVFTSVGSGFRKSETVHYDYTRPVVPCSGVIHCALESARAPSAYAGHAGRYGVWGVGGSGDEVGGFMGLYWSAGGWYLERGRDSALVQTVPLVPPDTLRAPYDVYYTLTLAGSLQVRLKGYVAGVLTEIPGLASTPDPTLSVRVPWSVSRIYLGAGSGGQSPGPWRLYYGKFAPGGGKTFQTLEGII